MSTFSFIIILATITLGVVGWLFPKYTLQVMSLQTAGSNMGCRKFAASMDLSFTDRLWHITDQQGTVVGMADDTGDVTKINTYDEYGVPAYTNEGRFQYTGQMWIAEASLYHYKARAYDPYLKRFLQADPIGYSAGMNMYAYVSGDPVNYTDPWGLEEEGEIVVTARRIKNYKCKGVCIRDINFIYFVNIYNSDFVQQLGEQIGNAYTAAGLIYDDTKCRTVSTNDPKTPIVTIPVGYQPNYLGHGYGFAAPTMIHVASGNFVHTQEYHNKRVVPHNQRGQRSIDNVQIGLNAAAGYLMGEQTGKALYAIKIGSPKKMDSDPRKVLLAVGLKGMSSGLEKAQSGVFALKTQTDNSCSQ